MRRENRILVATVCVTLAASVGCRVKLGILGPGEVKFLGAPVVYERDALESRLERAQAAGRADADRFESPGGWRIALWPEERLPVPAVLLTLSEHEAVARALCFHRAAGFSIQGPPACIANWSPPCCLDPRGFAVYVRWMPYLGAAAPDELLEPDPADIVIQDLSTGRTRSVLSWMEGDPSRRSVPILRGWTPGAPREPLSIRSADACLRRDPRTGEVLVLLVELRQPKDDPTSVVLRVDPDSGRVVLLVTLMHVLGRRFDVSTSGRYLLFNSGDKDGVLWDRDTGRIEAPWAEETFLPGEVVPRCDSPDGSCSASISEDGTELTLVGRDRIATPAAFRLREEGRIELLSWSPDSRFLAGTARGVPFVLDSRDRCVLLGPPSDGRAWSSACVVWDPELIARLEARGLEDRMRPERPTLADEPPSPPTDPLAPVMRDPADRIVTDEDLDYLGWNDLGFQEYRHRATGIELIYVPPGEFEMGADDGLRDEFPAHRVALEGFLIGKYEVTRGQYHAFCDASRRSHAFWGKLPYPGYDIDPQFDRYPVVSVSPSEAREFCAWAELRLPTEAEWERAARGTDGRAYPWGNEEPDGTRCNLADRCFWASFSLRPAWAPDLSDGYARSAPIGAYPRGRSAVGAYDMAGNVSEWCADIYDPDFYSRTPHGARNPLCADSTPAHDLSARRGGSWSDPSSWTRATHREPAASRSNGPLVNTGLRVARGCR